MKKNILLLIIPFLLYCWNKDDTLDAGKETKVFGNIYDIPNNIPFVNLKLKIANGEVTRTLYTNKNPDTSIDFIRVISTSLKENYYVVVPASNTTESANFNISIENSNFN